MGRVARPPHRSSSARVFPARRSGDWPKYDSPSRRNLGEPRYLQMRARPVHRFSAWRSLPSRLPFLVLSSPSGSASRADPALPLFGEASRRHLQLLLLRQLTLNCICYDEDAIDYKTVKRDRREREKTMRNHPLGHGLRLPPRRARDVARRQALRPRAEGEVMHWWTRVGIGGCQSLRVAVRCGRGEWIDAAVAGGGGEAARAAGINASSAQPPTACNSTHPSNSMNSSRKVCSPRSMTLRQGQLESRRQSVVMSA